MTMTRRGEAVPAFWLVVLIQFDSRDRRRRVCVATLSTPAAANDADFLQTPIQEGRDRLRESKGLNVFVVTPVTHQLQEVSVPN